MTIQADKEQRAIKSLQSKDVATIMQISDDDEVVVVAVVNDEHIVEERSVCTVRANASNMVKVRKIVTGIVMKQRTWGDVSIEAKVKTRTPKRKRK